MASEVDIANLALAHLGDTATVASLNPPEGSAQAEHCARFYPIARDALLEMFAWGFATRRVQPAALASSTPEWDYAYAMPADAINIIAVIPPGSSDDYSIGMISGGAYTPQAFAREIDARGADVIYSDQPDAVVRYTAFVTDTTRFPPLFVMALSWHLASMLAGPILKGDVGAAESKRCAGMMQAYLSQASESDANQRLVKPQHNVGWITGR
ncbi:MAG: hypothetical protein KKH74_06430 [Gammaproteobacteria bacterium]|nr:hypothetical protein [Gammaproteobacteria bacterium]MBU1732280.1 hypothetical protein [Gammaproteobacteria bacterium]MBU1893850.1 hypothetical protein [Gammaproteobacteria bacterium]